MADKKIVASDGEPPAAPAPERQLGVIEKEPVGASSIRLGLVANEFTLIFQRTRPAIEAVGSEERHLVINEAVAVIQLSPQTLKDLSTLVNEKLQEYEKEFGAIDTAYLRRRRQQQPQ